MSRRFCRVATAVAVALLYTTPVAAQCPDGTPPPCGRRVGATARAGAPPLDDRTWIVVPFDNLARSADADWLRSASVNLLYLDMSRWQDIRVIDDERVADLVRETPQAARGSPLSLNDGLAIAKRAGAGRLVMGDVVRIGQRTSVNAKVFDVRTGLRVRSANENAVAQDSVIPLFGKLARKILDVAPPEGTSLGAIGTTRLDAYQEYVAGLGALHRFDLAEARRRLGQALALDSTFALAQWKMAVAFSWDDPGNPAQRLHAGLAARYQAGLPARVRNLITGILYQSANEWSRSCDVYSAIVRADSADTEGWYGIGECMYHDSRLEAVDGDTTRLRFRFGWNEAFHAFRRVLELDPQYHLAYRHIIDGLSAERRFGMYCPMTSVSCTNYQSHLVRTGDSLVSTPVRTTDAVRAGRQEGEYWTTLSKRRNLADAEAVARDWVRAAPAETRALTSLAAVLAAEGKLQESGSVLRRTSASGTANEDTRRAVLQMEVEFKTGSARAAARVYDSLRAANSPLPGGSGRRLGNIMAIFGGSFGRFGEVDSLINASSGPMAPATREYRLQMLRVAAGAVPSDTITMLESDLFALVKEARGVAVATRTIGPSLMYWLRGLRRTWPALDTTVQDLKLRPALALSRGDTLALRGAARSLDSLLRASAAAAGNDTGFTSVATEAYLALGDTTAALKVLRFRLDTALAIGPYFGLAAPGITTAHYVPRLTLLRADLAAARGLKAEAREWYRRFIEGWTDAVAELQPIVARARRELAALGPP